MTNAIGDAEAQSKIILTVGGCVGKACTDIVQLQGAQAQAFGEPLNDATVAVRATLFVTNAGFADEVSATVGVDFPMVRVTLPVADG